MAQTAAHLDDHVIPRVPVRQWVLSLPIPLRLLLADHLLDGEVFASPVRPFVRAMVGGRWAGPGDSSSGSA